VQPITESSGNSDQRDEALRLAKEAGLLINVETNPLFHCVNQDVIVELESSLVRLIALARASAAPQETEPDPSDELVWYKWAHKELGRRNAKLAEENFQYWQKERDAAPQPQAATSDDAIAAIQRQQDSK
jgi:hypothetical protein